MQPMHALPICRYSLRVGVHNGRTFVGPCYELVNTTTMDVPGWKVLQVGEWGLFHVCEPLCVLK